MALVQCPECKQEISDQAATCPHCGAPQHRPAPAAQPTASPGGTAPARRPFPWPLVLVLVLGVGALLLVLSRRPAGGVSEAPALPAAPAPKWIIDNVDATDACTELGEYCIRVRCAITNAGSASGIAQVAVELKEDSAVIATRRGTRSVGAGQQDTLTLDFPEANLGKEHSFRCYPIQ
jgi:hypothetical protein